ncbi:MAG: CoA transferase [Candidatus Eremiobacteraeota bacterium]|nr:CoA transferase [Candidatus Eremiobacteraeota bacterium]
MDAGALSGTRVVALVTNVPGPVAASRLRAMGADVVKIEPAQGDPLAAAAPEWYAALHRDVRVQKLKLRDDPDRALLRELIAEADVLLTATRASALERARLQWRDLHERHPSLVHVAVVGEAAQHADRAGHDLTYQARAGLLSPPSMPRTLVADMAAAAHTVSATLAALVARSRDGAGRYVEVSIVDAARTMAEPLRYGLTTLTGPLGGALPAYRVYPAAEGWVAVAALEAHFLERLRELLNVDRLDETSIAMALATRSAAAWEELANASDVPLAAVATQAMA